MAQAKDILKTKNGVTLSEVNLLDRNGNRIALTYLVEKRGPPFKKTTQNFMEAEALSEEWAGA